MAFLPNFLLLQCDINKNLGVLGVLAFFLPIFCIIFSLLKVKSQRKLAFLVGIIMYSRYYLYNRGHYAGEIVRVFEVVVEVALHLRQIDKFRVIDST